MRSARDRLAVALLVAGPWLWGCEGGQTDAPSAEQTVGRPADPEPTPVPDGQTIGPAGSGDRKSTLGRARQGAENVVDKIEQQQQELLKQIEKDSGGGG